MKESTGKEEKMKPYHDHAGQNEKALQQLGKLLAKANAEGLRTMLTTDTVTELLEDTFGVNAAPSILYQGKPYFYPSEVSRYFTTKEVMQRDIRIEVPCNGAGAVKIVLVARSWIAMDGLDEEFRELLRAGKMTIGQIIRKRHSSIGYQNLSYKEVRSTTLATAFKTQGSVHLIKRSRMIYHKKKTCHSHT